MSKFAQTFSRFRQNWELNEKTNRLEKTDQTDLQAEVNSKYDEAMFVRLCSYFDENEVPVSTVDSLVENFDDLGGAKIDKLCKALSTVNDFRERYKISDEVSEIDVLNAVKTYGEKIKEKIKGGTTNEKTQKSSVPQEKQPSVPEVRTPDTQEKQN